MSDDLRKLERVQKLLEVADQDYATTEEVAQVVSAVASAITEVRETTDSAVAFLETTTTRKLSALDEAVEAVDVKVSQTTKKLEQKIDKVKTIKGDPGEKGDKGDKGDTPTIDEDAIARKMLAKVPTPKLIKEIVREVDDTKLKDLERMIRANQQALPVTTTHFSKNGSPLGRAKNINILEGSNVSADVYVQGDTATIVISSNASGGSNIDTEQVNATQSGDSSLIDLTQLANTFTAIKKVFLNGILVKPGTDPGDGTTAWTVSATTLTVFNSAAGDTFIVEYTYA